MPEFPGRFRPPRLSAAPSSPANGEVYYNTTDNLLYWWNGSAWIGAGKNLDSARVYNSAALSINHATYTTLTFNSERWDSIGMHDTVSNTSRLVCKVAGLYLVGFNVIWAANGVGQRQHVIQLSTGQQIGRVTGAAAAAIDHSFALTTVAPLAFNDYAELIVYQDSGAALNISASAGLSPEFFMVRVS